jgi:hypothetical protein
MFREYLVNYDYFFQILEKYGFKLLTADESKEINLPSSFGSFEELHRQLQIDMEKGTTKSHQVGRALHMNKEEKQISFFNSYFVCKKVRHETTPVRLIDSIIDEEDQILMSTYVNSLEKEDNQSNNGTINKEQDEEKEEPAPKITIEDPFSPIQTSEPEKITLKKKPGRKKKIVTKETETQDEKTTKK